MPNPSSSLKNQVHPGSGALARFKLSAACERGDWQTARELALSGASLIDRDVGGRRPLSLWLARAAESGQMDGADDLLALSRGPSLGSALTEAFKSAAESEEPLAILRVAAMALPHWPRPSEGGGKIDLWRAAISPIRAEGALESRLRAGAGSEGFRAAVKELGEGGAGLGHLAFTAAGSWVQESGSALGELPAEASRALLESFPEAGADVRGLCSAGLWGEALKAVERAGGESALALLCARFGSDFPEDEPGEEPGYGLSVAALGRALGQEPWGHDTDFGILASRWVLSSRALTHQTTSEVPMEESIGFWRGVAKLAEREAAKPEASAARSALISGSAWASRECGLKSGFDLNNIDRMSAQEATETAMSLIGEGGEKEALARLARRLGQTAGESWLAARDEVDGVELDREWESVKSLARVLASALWEEEEPEAFEALALGAREKAGIMAAVEATRFPSKARALSDHREKPESAHMMLALLRAYPQEIVEYEEGGSDSVWSELDLRWALKECSARAGESLFAWVCEQEGEEQSSKMTSAGWEAFETAARGSRGDSWRSWDAAAAALTQASLTQAATASSQSGSPYWLRDFFEISLEASYEKSTPPLPRAFDALCRGDGSAGADVLIRRLLTARGAGSWDRALGQSANGWRLTLEGLSETGRENLIKGMPAALISAGENAGSRANRNFAMTPLAARAADVAGRSDEERALLCARWVIAAALGSQAWLPNLDEAAAEMIDALPQAALALMELGNLSEPARSRERLSEEKESELSWSSREMSDANWIGAAALAAARFERMSAGWAVFPAAGESGALPDSPELRGAASGAFAGRVNDCDWAIKAALGRVNELIRLGAGINDRAPGLSSALEMAVSQRPWAPLYKDSERRSWGPAAAKELIKLGASPSTAGSEFDALSRACLLTRAESATAVASELLQTADCGSGKSVSLIAAMKASLSPKMIETIKERGLARPKRSCLAPLISEDGGRGGEAVELAFANAQPSEWEALNESGLSLLGEMAQAGDSVLSIKTAHEKIKARDPEFEPSSADKDAFTRRLIDPDLTHHKLKLAAAEWMALGASREARIAQKVKPATARSAMGEGADNLLPTIDGLGKSLIELDLPVASSWALVGLDALSTSDFRAAAESFKKALILADAGASLGAPGDAVLFADIWSAIDARNKERPKERDRMEKSGLTAEDLARLEGFALLASSAPGVAAPKRHGRL